MSSQVKEKDLLAEYAATVEVDAYKKSVGSGTYLLLKRIFDLIASIICMIPALIIIFIFGVMIKLESPGSMFYTQKRVGLNGKCFKIIKLRSMRNDAEKHGAKWTERNDPRVTRIGSFIRKSRIDELPQLFNVLTGDMSLIGPRPERPVFTAQFNQEIPGFINRVSVKPGLTGWAQVNGGYDITPEEKLELDLYYINNISLKMECKIFLKTVKIIFTGDGAR